MKQVLVVWASLILIPLSAWAQEPPLHDALLDHMVGKWVLRGTIGGAETTHDIYAEWVLGHEYVRLHEVSREKNASGLPAYEAIVFIGWDRTSDTYACLWLDTTGGGGLSAQAIGHAKRGDDKLAFLFTPKEGIRFHTTFVYSKTADTWQWLMDDEEEGKLQPFARVRLDKK